MRLSPLILAVLAAVLGAFLFFGPCRPGGGGKRVEADSLADVADSIAEAARSGLGEDSAASGAADSVLAAGDTLLGVLADSLKDLDRVDAELRRRGPVRIARDPAPVRQAPEAVALDTAPAPTGADEEARTYRDPEWAPCALGDEACSDSVSAALDTVAPPTPIAATASDSIAWLLALDRNNLRRISNLTRQRDRALADKAEAVKDRDRWRDRAGILGRQVGELQRATHAAADLVKPPTLDLGIVKIPRPCLGAGPGATAGVASNGQGTGFGVAAGLTVAAIFPFSGGCGT